MRTALCISGQPRKVKECFPYLLENIILSNAPCDVFLHVWFNSEWEENGKWTPYWDTQIDKSSIALLSTLYNPVAMLVEQQKEFDTSQFDPNNALCGEGQYRIDASYSMFYSIQKCNQLKKDFEAEHGFTYDIVGRTRSDFKIQTKIEYKDYVSSTVAMSPTMPGVSVEERVPRLLKQHREAGVWAPKVTGFPAEIGWGCEESCKGQLSKDAIHMKLDCKHEPACCNDHLAFGSSKSIDFYSDCFNYLEEIVNEDGSPFCPEIILGRYLRKYNKEINFIEFESEIYR